MIETFGRKSLKHKKQKEFIPFISTPCTTHKQKIKNIKAAKRIRFAGGPQHLHQHH